MAVVGMDFTVFEEGIGVVVFEVDVYCHHVDGLAVLNSVFFYHIFVSLEIRWFIHIQPNP
jgi:hypothetical protein